MFRDTLSRHAKPFRVSPGIVSDHSAASGVNLKVKLKHTLLSVNISGGMVDPYGFQ
jgi:hypothetical protein